MGRAEIWVHDAGPVPVENGVRLCWGKKLNAYVRLGTPSRWTVVGSVCVRCKRFWTEAR